MMNLSFNVLFQKIKAKCNFLTNYLIQNLLSLFIYQDVFLNIPLSLFNNTMMVFTLANFSKNT